jgi:hypothetical protein
MKAFRVKKRVHKEGEKPMSLCELSVERAESWRERVEVEDESEREGRKLMKGKKGQRFNDSTARDALQSKLQLHSCQGWRLLAGDRKTGGCSNKFDLVPESCLSFEACSKGAGKCGAAGSSRLELCCAVRRDC